MEKQLPRLGTGSIVMRWGDMDAVGHLNNATYYRFMEQIRIDWLESLGQPIDPAGTGPVIAATACVYKTALVYPATVDITLEVEKLGRSSLKMRHHFYRRDDPDTVYAVGEVTLVWINYQSGKSVPIPDVVRTPIEAAIAAHEAAHATA